MASYPYTTACSPHKIAFAGADIFTECFIYYTFEILNQEQNVINYSNSIAKLLKTIQFFLLRNFLLQRMKNQQTELNNSTIEDITSKAMKIHCINHNPALLMCANQKCPNFSFICPDLKCKCHQEHHQCQKSEKNTLVNALVSKIISYKGIYKKIKQQIQKAINNLYELEQTLLKQCKQKCKEFVGLNHDQKEFIQFIELGNINQIKGKTIKNMVLNHKTDNQTVQMMNRLQQNVQKIWNQFEKDLDKLQLGIKNTLSIFGKQPNMIFADSKVIMNQEQNKIIQRFFESQGQKIKRARLLFRGSQNYFYASRFHNACDGHGSTITICENTYGKKFGGYTPLEWNSSNSYFTDSTYKSFMFSLSNNHKLIPASQSFNHIFCNQSYGPTFGQAYDLFIANECNNTCSSYCYPNYSYKNNNYSHNKPESWQYFIGSGQKNNFYVKEYQVWKVQFA